jgi:hypothetical protein
MLDTSNKFLWGSQLLAWSACLGVIFRLLWQGLTRQSTRAALAGLGGAMVFGLVFSPWTSLREFSSSSSSVISWNPLYRAFTFVWMFLLFLAAALVVLLPWIRRQNSWRVRDLSSLLSLFRSVGRKPHGRSPAEVVLAREAGNLIAMPPVSVNSPALSSPSNPIANPG